MQPLIICFIVCMTLGLFRHVEDFLWVPKCDLQRSILSRTQDKSDGEGIPGVRGFVPLCILLCHLSPQGVGLWSSTHVQLFHDRLIREKCGRHCVFSRLMVVGGNRWWEKVLVRSQRVLPVLVITSLLDNRDKDSSPQAIPYHQLSMVWIWWWSILSSYVGSLHVQPGLCLELGREEWVYLWE